MSGIERLSTALNLLKTFDKHIHIQLIGELGWASIPEAYEFMESWVVDSHRIDIYKLKGNIIVNISDVGLFQIM
jgi:hypothetical protein